LKAFASAGAALLFAAAVPAAGAAELRVTVKNDSGEAMEHAVVTARPLGGAPASAGGEVMIDQKGKEFIPFVSAVPVGTRVRFPNSDDIRHHVYSFSPAKTFEIPLYKGTPANPVVFDKPGIVVLGCNIHDWMSAYVYVSPTPYFSITPGDGAAKFNTLPPGRYAVEVWHPQIKGAPEPAQHELTLRQADSAELAFVLKLKPAWGARRASSVLQGGYR
jgi:plastocyanin